MHHELMGSLLCLVEIAGKKKPADEGGLNLFSFEENRGDRRIMHHRKLY